MVGSVSIIPLPIEASIGSGQYSFPDTVVVRADGPGADAVCSYLVTYLQDQLHVGASSSDGNPPAIQLVCGPSQSTELSQLPLPAESYELNIEEEGVRVSAQTSTGLFYGIQSLIQLLPSCPQEGVSLAHVKVRKL